MPKSFINMIWFRTVSQDYFPKHLLPSNARWLSRVCYCILSAHSKTRDTLHDFSNPIRSLHVTHFGWKPGGLWLSPWLPSKYKKHCQNSPSAISGSIWIFWSDENIPSDALQNGATLIQREREETNCWINVFIFIFFAYKKYSRRFINFRLNHWWQMDYFDCFFYTFLCFDSVIYLAVKGTVTSLPVFIQNILNCVSRTKSFYGFGTTWG